MAIVDVPDPLEGGPAYLLYTQEFYELLKARLRTGGVMVAQSGPTGPAFYQQCFADVAKTIGSVFPSVYVYETFVPSFGSTWGFALSVEEVDRRTGQRVDHELRHYDGITHRGMFSVPKYLRRSLATEGRIITRATPLYTP